MLSDEMTTDYTLGWLIAINNSARLFAHTFLLFIDHINKTDAVSFFTLYDLVNNDLENP